MRLEALKFIERRKIRIVVIQMDHKPDSHLIFCLMINKATASGITAQRPAQRVTHRAWAILFRRNFPEFLEPQTVMLMLSRCAQFESFLQFTGQRSARACSKHGITAMQPHSPCDRGPGLTAP